MAPRKTTEEIRRELSDLILEAVPEPDPVRRTALLTLADHWSELLRKRRAELEARGADAMAAFAPELDESTSRLGPEPG